MFQVLRHMYVCVNKIVIWIRHILNKYCKILLFFVVEKSGVVLMSYEKEVFFWATLSLVIHVVLR